MNAIPLTGLALTGAALTAVPRIVAARPAVPLNRDSAAICGLLQRLGLTTVGAWSNF